MSYVLALIWLTQFTQEVSAKGMYKDLQIMIYLSQTLLLKV